MANNEPKPPPPPPPKDTRPSSDVFNIDPKKGGYQSV
jgi:hypothetical protein